jgi:hypothetical protein
VCPEHRQASRISASAAAAAPFGPRRKNATIVRTTPVQQRTGPGLLGEQRPQVGQGLRRGAFDLVPVLGAKRQNPVFDANAHDILGTTGVQGVITDFAAAGFHA